MGKKRKKTTWNKRSGKMIPSKFLKPRRDPGTDKGEDNNCRQGLFKKKFAEAIKEAAKT